MLKKSFCEHIKSKNSFKKGYFILIKCRFLLRKTSDNFSQKKT